MADIRVCGYWWWLLCARLGLLWYFIESSFMLFLSLGLSVCAFYLLSIRWDMYGIFVEWECTLLNLDVWCSLLVGKEAKVRVSVHDSRKKFIYWLGNSMFLAKHNVGITKLAARLMSAGGICHIYLNSVKGAVKKCAHSSKCLTN